MVQEGLPHPESAVHHTPNWHVDSGKEETMYALIYDEHDPLKSSKQVISIHKTREEAEEALENRRRMLHRSIQECNTRIVWAECEVRQGDHLTGVDFDAWRPGEKIPAGELYSDTD